ncbi:OmpA family protein [Herbaspirillum sp. RTI4]|uniref:OmpA family protein n=1 Tax=Herbaspirillum sp. RTI4 TaxID=3048640 RepID=UPI002AB5227E|nr:OmpA family protein [Herbaspirillum sp. RTI4]MDY7579505.1 OmpA family protein [Herbaspirillum sp. RTI4]MEA9980419.1 OmpA family protein [Herbaspirillum sp. RTI4]
MLISFKASHTVIRWRVAFGAMMTAIALSLVILSLGQGLAHATPTPAGATIRNVATVTYVPAGLTQTETVRSNAVLTTVQAVEALTLTQSQSLTRSPSVTVTLSHLLTNRGNTPSRYTLNWINGGAACAADSADLSGLKLVRDINNNGVADADEPAIALDVPGSLTLAPGEVASLLAQGVTPSIAAGTACLTLSATTALQGITASNNDSVTIGSNAVLQLTKSASYPSQVVPGMSDVAFTITGNNIGAQDALPTPAATPAAIPVLVDGAPRILLLLRDLIPMGTRYNAHSLQTSAPGGIKLFRMATDGPYRYRTVDSGDAVEVAIGLSDKLTPNSSVSMNFSVRTATWLNGNILNNAQAYFNDGVGPVEAISNTVVIASAPTRIGLAKAATTPIANVDSHGNLDDTATARFSLRVKNYGRTTLQDVQISDVLEGMGATQFGSYVSQTVPGLNQYTIVPGTLSIAGNNGIPGIVAAVNPGFTGQSSAQTLLAPHAVLPAGADLTVQFDLRVNLKGRSGTLLNQARADAALIPGGAIVTTDLSTDGADPDPDGDGNPGNNSVPTPFSTQLSALTLVKTASLPRRIGAGVFELDYSFKVSNIGSAPASNLRLIDNLNCTFEMDLPTGRFARWSLIGKPVVQNGVLIAASSFTGRAACDRAGINNAHAAASVPGEVALSMVDGTRELAPGQSETVKLTVRVIEKPDAIGSRTLISNKAWAAGFKHNTVNLTPDLLQVATSAKVDVLLTDPMGTVYDMLTRQPVAGALVTFTRTSCAAGPTGPITSDQIYSNDATGAYTFNPDGSVSTRTEADGAYQFSLKTPPVNDLCTYALSVTPPDGSGYRSPSQGIPPMPGTYASCGAVTPRPTPPAGSDPTTYYLSVRTGINSGDASVCDVVHNHIPLDHGNLTGLVLQKEGSKMQAEFGDFLDYSLTLTNKTDFPVTGATFSDTLPVGFGYVQGSARLNGQQVADPQGGAGPLLTFNYPGLSIPLNTAAVVRYRVRIGVGAPTDGDAVNRASASSGPLQSNLASFKTHISGGVFADEAYAFGKVYLDCKRDGTQDKFSNSKEIGIPGVRLYLENGTSVVTDSEGKWSLYGLKPLTHVLRLDQTTLPPGATLEVLDNRNSDSPESRFLDLKKGEFHKANFIVTNCDNEAMLAEVEQRRAALALQRDTEAEAQVRTRLNADGSVVQMGDVRALPASGQSTANGATGSPVPPAAALIRLPAGSVNGGAFAGSTSSGLNGTLGNASLPAPAGGLFSALSDRLAGKSPVPAAITPTATPIATPTASATPVDLETLMPQLDNTLDFVGWKEGDVAASSVINVRVKGATGATLRLLLNGQVVEENRVGKKSALPSRQVVAWEYIGVALKPGVNRLLLEAMDDFGNARAQNAITIVAPDKLGEVHIDLPVSARADLRTPVVVKVRLTDAKGVPVTARTQLTLESDRGRWSDKDLNAIEPGVQVFMEGGSGEFQWMPPGEPGDARLRVSAGNIVAEARLALLPEMRPMIGVGIVEGVLDFTQRGGLPAGAMSAGAAFENELRGMKNDSNDQRRASARSAFFFKGTVKGEYLLTAAFDSDKVQKDRLFRDIRPDEFYPIYGDSSEKGFDAQSTQKLYVRIDKDRSYLLYGDFTTASSAEVRQLSQSNRSLTGAKQVFENEWMRATSYASRTAQTQQVEEFRALGISGPYYLRAGGGELVANSEQIEILVRDRNQPATILQRIPMQRFVDYTIEPMTRRILFTHPISSVDPNLNPQSIRVTYELENGGPEFTVAGTDVQFKLGDKVQAGVVASVDENPANHRKLTALTGIARLGEHTSMATELVKTDSELKGDGSAGRLELRHQDGKLSVVTLMSKTTAGFDNPAASFSAGRTEASARAEYKIDPTLTLRTDAGYSKDLLSQERKGVSAALQKKLSETLAVEGGLRHGRNDAVATSGFDYGQVSSYGGSPGAASVTSLGAAAANAADDDNFTAARMRVTSQVPGLSRAQVFVEGEQDIHHGDRRELAIGGNYAITDKTRLYGRYELLSSLQGPSTLNGSQSNNIGVLGIESNYMEGGRVYNEYRLADSMDGKSAQAAFGVRNTFKITERLRLTGGFEHTRNLGGYSNSVNQGTGFVGGLGESTALISGLEYMTDRLKASGVAEARNGDDANTRLLSAGVGYKLDSDWSLLARTILSDSQGRGANSGNSRFLMRNQLGAAYRPVDQDLWNALGRYEHKIERVQGSGTTAGAWSGNYAGSAVLPGSYTTDIVSTHLNVNPARGNYLTARYAGKIAYAKDDFLNSTYWAHLLQGRYTKDLNKSWDVGVQAGVLYGKGGAVQRSVGVEVGYQLHKNLWLSGGYNFVGLNDRDLTANEYTSKGAFIRLRYKFDETTFGFDAPTARAPVFTAPPPAPMPPIALPVVTEPVVAPLPPQIEKLGFQAEALFDSGKSVIKPQGRAALEEFANRMRGMGGAGSAGSYVVTIVGHTDGQGSARFNQRLSEQRASAVRDYLIAQGADAAHIKSEGRGLRQPVASNATAQGRQQNRRVEIEISGTAVGRTALPSDHKASDHE